MIGRGHAGKNGTGLSKTPFHYGPAVCFLRGLIFCLKRNIVISRPFWFLSDECNSPLRRISTIPCPFVPWATSSGRCATPRWIWKNRFHLTGRCVSAI